MTVWASNWGQWKHLFSAVASSGSLSLLLCYDIGSDNTNTTSVKNSMLTLFHKPLPNFNQSQWYHSMSAIFSRLFDQATSRSNYFKEQSQWRRRRVGHFVHVKIWWSLNQTHTSKWQAWHLAKGLELRMNLFAPAFTLQHAPCYDGIYVLCVKRKNKCLWAPQGWQKSATDLPSQTQSWMALFQFCTRADLLYKGSAANGPLTPGSRKRVSQSRSLIVLLGPLMI